MARTTAALKSQDPLRTYIVTLRVSRGLTQPALAEAAGVRPRTYISWENGETEKLDVDVAERLIDALGGLWDHVKMVRKMSAEQARAFAEQWISLSSEDREAATQAAHRLNRIVVRQGDDPVMLEDVIRRLRDQVRDDPEALALIRCYLAGISARSH